MIESRLQIRDEGDGDPGLRKTIVSGERKHVAREIRRQTATHGHNVTSTYSNASFPLVLTYSIRRYFHYTIITYMTLLRYYTKLFIVHMCIILYHTAIHSYANRFTVNSLPNERFFVLQLPVSNEIIFPVNNFHKLFIHRNSS